MVNILHTILINYLSSNQVQKDDMVPDLLVLPPGADLHNHPLVKNGSVLLQVIVLTVIECYRSLLT